MNKKDLNFIFDLYNLDRKKVIKFIESINFNNKLNKIIKGIKNKLIISIEKLNIEIINNLIKKKNNKSDIIKELVEIQIGLYYIQELTHISENDLNKAINDKINLIINNSDRKDKIIMPTMSKTNEIKYEIIEEIGVIWESERGKPKKKEINLVSWNDGEAKIDIRIWNYNEEGTERISCGKGITMTLEETENLSEVLKSYFNTDEDNSEEEYDEEYEEEDEE